MVSRNSGASSMSVVNRQIVTLPREEKRSDWRTRAGRGLPL